MAVRVAVGTARVGSGVAMGGLVAVGVAGGVTVGVAVGVTVGVAVAVAVGVVVAVAVAVAVAVGVGLAVAVGVAVGSNNCTGWNQIPSLPALYSRLRRTGLSARAFRG